MLYTFQQGLLNMPPKRDPDRRLLLLPIHEIRPNPNAPRKSTDRAALSELMISIAQVGLIEPLSVRQVADEFELIAGSRRLKACELLGWREVPCIVLRASEEKSALMALCGNLQRRDLGYLEEAESMQALCDAFGLTQEQLETKLGKSRTFVSGRLRLLNLSREVRARLRTDGLSERHAKALLRLDDDERRQQAMDVIERRRLNAAASERLVDTMAPNAGAAPLRVRRFPKDCRLFVNSVKSCIDQLDGTGITADMEENRRDDGIDLIIRLRT